MTRQRDPMQMSIFDEDQVPERIDGVRVIRNNTNSWKPSKFYKVLAHDRQEWPAETLIIEAVSDKQAKFFYNKEVGHQYKYNWSIREVLV